MIITSNYTDWNLDKYKTYLISKNDEEISNDSLGLSPKMSFLKVYNDNIGGYF